MRQRMIRWVQRHLSNRGIELRRVRHSIGALSHLPDGAPRTVLDIGANAGQFARRVRTELPSAVLHSFEPLPAPFAALQAWAAGQRRVHCHNIALGDSEGVVEIHTGAYTASSSLLAPTSRLQASVPHAVPTEIQKVKVMRLDDWAYDVRLEAPVFIKMDVQGFEKGVLCGGEKTIAQASAVLVELSFVRLYENQPLFGDMVELFSALDFQLADIYDVSRDPSSGLGFQCDGLFLPRRTLHGLR